jgi:hypothetical protein
MDNRVKRQDGLLWRSRKTSRSSFTPAIKKSFRIKGKLDNLVVKALAIIPIGGGNFILPLNAELRKKLAKRKGEEILLVIERDKNRDPVPLPDDLAACLEDEPAAREHFFKLPKSHQNYYIKWITSAKTEPTRVRRIAQAIDALAREKHYGEMMREMKDKGMGA